MKLKLMKPSEEERTDNCHATLGMLYISNFIISDVFLPSISQ